MATLDAKWCAWFSGFVDGEASFNITRVKPRPGTYESWTCDFRIKLRNDDRPLLEEIRAMLGCGNVSAKNLAHNRANGGQDRDQAEWYVNRKSDLQRIIIPLLTDYPLRSKKRHDFAIWSEAVDVLCRKAHLGGNFNVLVDIKLRLVASRQYSSHGLQELPNMAIAIKEGQA